MTEAEITFEREGRDGIVAVGSYLVDAMKRLGIRLDADCQPAEDIHFCMVEIKEGAEHLSPLTAHETEHFSQDGRTNNERLACQAKIEKPGEIVVMTQEKKEESKKDDNKSDEYKKEFVEMPLEKKIASLVQLEAITLGETFSFIINSPFKILEKVGDVMAEFGMNLEKKAKDASRPAEHKKEESADKKPRSKTAKKTPQSKPATE
jgi:ferredoxin